jgi:hypothetical protein
VVEELEASGKFTVDGLVADGKVTVDVVGWHALQLCRGLNQLCCAGFWKS